MVLSLNSIVNFIAENRVVQYRPFLDNFLNQAGQLFELILWADEPKPVADPIADSIEQKGKIFSFRLYADHFSLKEGALSRDLTRLGR